MSKAKVMKIQQNQIDNNMIEDEESNSSIGNLDLTLLRRPITTSITGLEEVLRAYKDGTNEVRIKMIFFFSLKNCNESFYLCYSLKSYYRKNVI